MYASRTEATPALAERLVADYLRPLLNFVRRRVRYHEALGDVPPGAIRAEEVVDEALLHGLEHLRAQPQVTGLYRWLRRAARKRLQRELERTRQLKRQRSLLQPLPPGPRHDPDLAVPPRRLIDILPDPAAPVPESVVEDEEFQQAMVLLLGDLPEAWREPFLLHTLEGCSLRQIAEYEGIPLEEARRRIRLAREFLRARLAEEFEESEKPVPSEELFRSLRRAQPTAEHEARLREQLAAAAQLGHRESQE